MNSVHRFWALPKDAGPDLGRLLAGRFHTWDAVAVSECRAEETQTLYWLLRDYCWGKQGEAVTWSRDFLQRHALVFNRVRGLRDGYLPCRGLSATGMTVISQPEICHFMLALARLPQEPPVAGCTGCAGRPIAPRTICCIRRRFWAPRWIGPNIEFRGDLHRSPRMQFCLHAASR